MVSDDDLVGAYGCCEAHKARVWTRPAVRRISGPMHSLAPIKQYRHMMEEENVVVVVDG